MTSPSALIDSNILVYVFDAAHPREREICRKLMEECWRGRSRYAVSAQNLSEFYVAVTQKFENPLPREVAREFVELIVGFEGWTVLPVVAETVSRAIRIKDDYKIHYWDALLAAAMEQGGLRRILTENVSDFERVPWLEVENPLV